MCNGSIFKPLTEEQVLNIINQMHHTTCAMDPCNTKFLMKFKDTLIGIITKINQCLPNYRVISG